MAAISDSSTRYDLITSRIPEHGITGATDLKVLLAQNRTLKCLWVTSPTGKPHIGYLIPMLKFAEFLQAGCEIIVVLLDTYSFLDNVKYPMEQVLQRMECYKFSVIAMLQAIGIPLTKISFVQESSYQKTERWIKDQWRLCTLVSQDDVRNAWDRSYNPSMLSPMFCPGLQTLAEEHLDVDFQFGGLDQRGIFSFSDRVLPKLGYKKRPHIMNSMLPNLQGGKMSSSHPKNTKIMLTDSPEEIRAKITEADQHAKSHGTENGIFTALRDILIPYQELQHKLKVTGNGTNPNDSGVSISTANANVPSFRELEEALHEGNADHDIIVTAIADAFVTLLQPVRQYYRESTEWRSAENLAYPEDN